MANKVFIPGRSISMLLTIKHALLDDNDLALKVSGCGKLAAASYIDDLIEKAIKIETQYIDYKASFERVEEDRKLFLDLLSYHPEDLSDKRKTEIRVMVQKWETEDMIDGDE